MWTPDELDEWFGDDVDAARELMDVMRPEDDDDELVTQCPVCEKVIIDSQSDSTTYIEAAFNDRHGRETMFPEIVILHINCNAALQEAYDRLADSSPEALTWRELVEAAR